MGHTIILPLPAPTKFFRWNLAFDISSFLDFDLAILLLSFLSNSFFFLWLMIVEFVRYKKLVVQVATFTSTFWFIIFTNPSAQAGYDTRSFLSGV